MKTPRTRRTRSTIAWRLVAAFGAWSATVCVAAPRQAAEIAPAAPFAEARQISAYVREVFEDRDGTLWFGTNDEGVARHDGHSLVYLSTTDGLAGNAIRGIVQDPRGALWFATDGGLSRFEDGRFTTYRMKDGLASDDLWSLLCDRTGTIWVGTSEGVCRRVGERFEPFPLPRVHVAAPESRFSPKVVFAMCEDRDGHLWFGTDGEGVHRYDGTNFRSFTTKEGLAGNMVRALCEDRRGNVWIGTDGGGVSRWDGSKLQAYGKKDGLGNERVFEILEDRNGAMWFSTLGAGASRYDGTTFESAAERGLRFDGITCACGSGKPTPECHGTGGVHVQDMLEDRAGRLWFGCSGGLFRMDGERIVNVTRDGPWPARDAAIVALAPLGRMTDGEWRVTFESGTTQFDRWQWGRAGIRSSRRRSEPTPPGRRGERSPSTTGIPGTVRFA
ncbi:MAG: hypothetical protein JNM94_17035 [Phycisphaerae bacterium]|nr:hypothetical protein [Phycisphaerae bacterium]